MLAKEMKFKSLMRQRKCIENGLSAEADDGDPARYYLGQVFPENIQYFKEIGYDAKMVYSDVLLAITKGLPVYVFTIRDDVTLSEEELKQAESNMPEDDSSDNNGAEYKLEDIINAMFNFPGF